MKLLFLCVLFFLGHGLFGQGFTDKVFSGNINGITATLKIEPGSLHNDDTKNRYYGMLLGDDGSTYILMGDLNEVNQIKGSAWDKFTAQEFQFLLEIDEAGLDFNFGLDDNYGTTARFYQEGMEVPRESASQDNIDPGMIGVWRRTDSYSDPISGFSYVIEETLALHGDGTLQFSSKSAGGNSGVTGSTPGQQLKGYWKTENKTLFTGDYPTGPWMNNGAYLVDASTMMLKQPGGNKLWNRIQ